MFSIRGIIKRMNIRAIYKISDVKMITLYILISSFSILFANNVTFRVDISNETLISNCAPSLAGSFNDWNYTYSLNDQGNGIWQAVLDLSPNNYYGFKFGI